MPYAFFWNGLWFGSGGACAPGKMGLSTAFCVRADATARSWKGRTSRSHEMSARVDTQRPRINPQRELDVRHLLIDSAPAEHPDAVRGTGRESRRCRAAADR